MLDITPGAIPLVVNVSEYDENRQYTVTLIDEGGVYSIPSGTTAKVEGSIGGNAFSEPATVSGNTITFTLSESMTALAGDVWCKIKLEKDSKPIQTCAFILRCDKAGAEAGTVIRTSGFEDQVKEAAEAVIEDMDIVADVLNYNCADFLRGVTGVNQTYRGVTFAWNEDGTCTVSGTASGGVTFSNFINKSDGLPEKIKAGETYYFQTNAVNSKLQIFPLLNGEIIQNAYVNVVNEKKAVTIPANANGLIARIAVSNGVTVNETVYVRGFASMTNAELTEKVADLDGGRIGNPNAHLRSFGNSILTGSVWKNGSFDHLSGYANAPYANVASALHIPQSNVSHTLLSSTGLLYDAGSGSFLTNIKNTDLSGYDYLLTHFWTADMGASFRLGSLQSTAGDGTLVGAVLELLDYIETSNGLCTLVLVSVPPVRGTADVFSYAYGNGSTISDLDALMHELAELHHFVYLDWQSMELSYRYQDYTDGTNVHANNEDTYRVMGEYLARQICGSALKPFQLPSGGQSGQALVSDGEGGAEWGQAGVEVDSSLSVEGAAADAKAVGDILLPLNAEINGGIGEEIAVNFRKGYPGIYEYSDVSSTNTGRLVHDEYIAGAVKVSCDTGFNFFVVLYDENKSKEGILLSDGTVETTFSKSLYSDAPVTVPKGKYCRICARYGTGNNIALTDAQYIHVNKINPSLLESVDERLESFESEVDASVDTLNDYVIGAVGSDYDGEVAWSIGDPSLLGYTDTSATDHSRLISGFISGKVQLSATDDINLFVVQYDMSGNKEGAIMRDGTLNTSNTVDSATWYSMEAVIIPNGKQGRVMARKGTGNDIALTDAEYISIKNVSDSIVDKTQDSYLVSIAHPNLYQKNIALMGDSLTEQSSLWFTRITSKYYMNTRIEGHGNQRWWSNTQLPNGAVTQVDNLVASDFEPDFIVLEFGGNDIWQSPTLFGEYTDTADKTIAKTVPAMRYCIETLQSNYPDAKILVLMPSLRTNNGLEPEAQKTYRELANAVLDDYGIFRWDMYKYAGIVKSMMAADGVHMCALEGNYFVPLKALYHYSDAFGAALMNLG